MFCHDIYQIKLDVTPTNTPDESQRLISVKTR